MDEIVRGVHHELNNRVASLSAVEQVVSTGGSMTEPLRAALLSELARMRNAVSLLGRVPSSEARPLEAMRPEDAVGNAVDLVGLCHEWHDLHVEVVSCEDVLPVRADPAALQRSLLLSLVLAAREAGARQVRVTCANVESRVQISVRPVPARGGGSSMPEAERLAIAAWLRPSDGVVEFHPHDRECTISLPALTPSRSEAGSVGR